MQIYTKQQLEATSKEIVSTINKCNKMLPKFNEGTSQHTLCKNRIQAMKIAQRVVMDEMISCQYPVDTVGIALNNCLVNKEAYIQAQAPIVSIIRKCQKAIGKHNPGNATYTVLKRTIDAMVISQELIDRKLEKEEN